MTEMESKINKIIFFSSYIFGMLVFIFGLAVSVFGISMIYTDTMKSWDIFIAVGLLPLFSSGYFLFYYYKKFKILGSQKIILRNMKIKDHISKVDAENQKYNISSIIGFVLSIISIFGLGFFGIAGFVLGIVALAQIKYTHERGNGFAIAAIIIGFIWSFVIGILHRLVEAGF